MLRARRDTGTGIPPDQLARVFDLYFTTKGGGSGIGLSMVFRTVQLHNGDIDVESTPGAGTTFTSSCRARREPRSRDVRMRGMLLRVVALVCGLAAAALAVGLRHGQGARRAPLPMLAPPDAPPRVVAEYLPDPPLPAEPCRRGGRRCRRRRGPRAASRAAADADEARAGEAAAPAAAPRRRSRCADAWHRCAADQSVRDPAGAGGARPGPRRLPDARRRRPRPVRHRPPLHAAGRRRPKARNVMFAGKLADKAATMAAVLVR